MKYWRGYIAAGLMLALTVGLMAFAQAHEKLVDMFYPYMTRLIQTSLADWSSGIEVCLWQLIAVLLLVVFLASIVVMIVLRWNFFQWLGWVLAGASMLFLLHTGMYGLNSHAGPLAEDVRLNVTEYTVTELAEATTYFRDIAGALAHQVPRNGDETPDYPEFSELADMAGDNFHKLTYEKYLPVFAGSTAPVKELGWADLYTAMGITGVTMGLTGEAAVNPQTPVVAQPFVMCHEMAHRMCINLERDANLAAFLACDVSDNPMFRYSGYFMAYRYCYNALVSIGTTSANAAASEIKAGVDHLLQADLDAYNEFFYANRNEVAANLATNANDTYIKVSGDESGVASYEEVHDLLVSWYIQEIYLPAHKDEEVVFDPTDKSQVDLTDRVQPTEGETE